MLWDMGQMENSSQPKFWNLISEKKNVPDVSLRCVDTDVDIDVDVAIDIATFFSPSEFSGAYCCSFGAKPVTSCLDAWESAIICMFNGTLTETFLIL